MIDFSLPKWLDQLKLVLTTDKRARCGRAGLVVVSDIVEASMEVIPKIKGYLNMLVQSIKDGLLPVPDAITTDILDTASGKFAEIKNLVYFIPEYYVRLFGDVLADGKTTVKKTRRTDGKTGSVKKTILPPSRTSYLLPSRTSYCSIPEAT